MMNAAFRAEGIAAHYLALDTDPLDEALPLLHAMGFCGLSVTIPHKEAACRLAAEVDDTARAIGAVNTLKLSAHGWQGRNTDWLGAVRALEQVTRLEGRKALVVGAGGAGRAVVYGLQCSGTAVTLANRTAARAEELARLFGCACLPLEEAARFPWDILVQCTPLGMTGAAAGAALDFPLTPPLVVMDLVYRPVRTPLLHAAEARGCRTVSGLEMLLHQGVAQFEWWFGRRAPAAVMREALHRALASL
jgi:shikimate dehydrogenase